MSHFPKKIILLGATGSIGESTLKVLRKHPDKLKLAGIACDKAYGKLADICEEFDVPNATVYSKEAYQHAKVSGSFQGRNLNSGMEGLIELAGNVDADIVVVAVVGTLGLKPALAAIESGKDLALASKEILVMAGIFFTKAIKQANVKLLPVDSEHNAIFQCLHGESSDSIEKIILTASGGSFRDRALDTFHLIRPEEATHHPNWAMGKKITVDSCTMANKGLEVIEAHWLFNLPPENIRVMIHPTSIVHSMVEFTDGSILSQMSPPSMTFAIQHALLYPQRAEKTEPSLNFEKSLKIEFFPPDIKRYPCLQLAYDSLKIGGTGPTVFNAANEVSVESFLNKKIAFPDIAKTIEKTLESCNNFEPDTLEEVLEADANARQTASQIIRQP
ncbi:MAG: 1-deoxy-D-xylulose-5-phosphate reductoisomerase [Opitutaceae bacterium]|nr:1-deoxy-D-xylulose-5-phosphate reductoisomerase [Opitutaceae bacterium]|tara:strand:- start:125 stop:1291 length:1167 start_codon:yes stop_codon:yes gene_type:complete